MKTVFLLVLMLLALNPTKAQSELERIASQAMCKCFESQKTFSEEKLGECFETSLQDHQDLVLAEMEKIGDSSEEAGFKFGKTLFEKISVGLISECIVYARFINQSRQDGIKNFNKDSVRLKLAGFDKMPLSQQTTETYANAGLCQFILGDFEQAITQFNKALSKDPKNFQAQLFLGWAKEKTSKYDEAIAIYEGMAKETGSSYFKMFAALAKLGKEGKL